MSETHQVVEPAVEQPTFNPFGQESWTESLPTPTTEPKVETATGQPAAANEPATAEPTTQPEVKPEPQTNEWYKTYEWDSEETAKNEITRLRSIKPQEEIKFANDESKRLHEAIIAGETEKALDILSKQKTLNSLSTVELNLSNAAQVIKTNMQFKYPDLTQEEIDFKFNKTYSIGKEPVYDELKETEDEFNNRHIDWLQRKKDVEMELMIEAKQARPELMKYKTELVLPEINKQSPEDSEAQQKELERIEKLRSDYKQALESDYKKFDGFKATYKDDDVELAADYNLSDDEKVTLKKELEELNIDEFLMSRWFKDGKPNIIQTMKDIQLLKKGEELFQIGMKEGAAKMKEHYIKLKGNITVNANGEKTFQPQGNGQQSVSPFSQGAWSDKPPQVTN